MTKREINWRSQAFLIDLVNSKKGIEGINIDPACPTEVETVMNEFPKVRKYVTTRSELAEDLVVWIPGKRVGLQQVDENDSSLCLNTWWLMNTEETILTPREWETVRLGALGFPSRKVAQYSNLNKTTVLKMWNKAKDKLSVDSLESDVAWEVLECRGYLSTGERNTLLTKLNAFTDKEVIALRAKAGAGHVPDNQIEKNLNLRPGFLHYHRKSLLLKLNGKNGHEGLTERDVFKMVLAKGVLEETDFEPQFFNYVQTGRLPLTLTDKELSVARLCVLHGYGNTQKIAYALGKSDSYVTSMKTKIRAKLHNYNDSGVLSTAILRQSLIENNLISNEEISKAIILSTFWQKKVVAKAVEIDTTSVTKLAEALNRSPSAITYLFDRLHARVADLLGITGLSDDDLLKLLVQKEEI